MCTWQWKVSFTYLKLMKNKSCHYFAYLVSQHGHHGQKGPHNQGCTVFKESWMTLICDVMVGLVSTIVAGLQSDSRQHTGHVRVWLWRRQSVGHFIRYNVGRVKWAMVYSSSEKTAVYETTRADLSSLSVTHRLTYLLLLLLKDMHKSFGQACGHLFHS